MVGRPILQPKPPAMISSFKKITTALSAAAILAVSVPAASPGDVDWGTFAPEFGKQYVEVDINASLLKLAASFAGREEPEVAELLKSLERVRVNVFGVNDDNRADTMTRINGLRDKLSAEGWNRVVTVREHSGDDVAVFIKQDGEDSIHGVVVTVISRDGEAVLVNVVGNVAIDQIAKLGESLDIAPLRELKLKHADEAVES